MAICRNLSCETPAELTASADIAGKGVISAFLLSAFATIAAVLCGYLSDSLPEIRLGEVDLVMVAEFQDLVARYSKSNILQILHKVRCWPIRSRANRPFSACLTRSQRQEAVTKFVLCLSDQQLVTGLAILIAAVANPCTMSIVDFRLATALAWFSATTHLTTLDALQDYFQNRTAIREWRVFGMMVILVLLIYCTTIYVALDVEVTSGHNLMPLRCAFGKLSTLFARANPSIYLPEVVVLVFLIWLYTTRILQAYGHLSGDAFAPGLFTVNCIYALSSSPRMSLRELGGVANEIASEMTSFERQRILSSIRDARLVQKTAKWKERSYTWQWAVHSYCTSFLPAAPDLAFMLSFGISQVVLVRWTLNTKFRPTVDSGLGFGQIVPIILLILPIFAAAEIYYDARGDSRSQSGAEYFPPDERQLPPLLVDNSQDMPLDILPILSAADLNDRTMLELESLSQLYHNRSKSIKRLFYREYKDIEHITASNAVQSNVQDVVRREVDLLHQAGTLEAVEKSLSSNSKMVRYILLQQSLQSALLAILLNVDILERDIAALLLLFLQVSTRLYTWIRAIRWIYARIGSFPRWLSEVKDTQRF